MVGNDIKYFNISEYFWLWSPACLVRRRWRWCEGRHGVVVVVVMGRPGPQLQTDESETQRSEELCTAHHDCEPQLQTSDYGLHSLPRPHTHRSVLSHLLHINNNLLEPPEVPQTTVNTVNTVNTVTTGHLARENREESKGIPRRRSPTVWARRNDLLPSCLAVTRPASDCVAGSDEVAELPLRWRVVSCQPVCGPSQAWLDCSMVDLFCEEVLGTADPSISPDYGYSSTVSRLPPEMPYVCKAYMDPVLLEDSRVFRNMLHTEEFYISDTNYFENIQKEIKPHMRKLVTDWMLEVSGKK